MFGHFFKGNFKGYLTYFEHSTKFQKVKFWREPTSKILPQMHIEETLNIQMDVIIEI